MGKGQVLVCSDNGYEGYRVKVEKIVHGNNSQQKLAWPMELRSWVSVTGGQ